jgi:hypothetical protein
MARGSYWDPRAKRFLQPGDAGYDRLTFENLTLGPLELGQYGCDWDEDFEDALVAAE